MDYISRSTGTTRGRIMTIEEIDKIITDLSTQIPNMQAQLHQARGYKQALLDAEKPEEESEEAESAEE